MKEVLSHRILRGGKSKNQQVGLHQINSLCTTKKTINTMKRQLMEWKKIFANQISDKVLIFKIHKELIQLNSKKKKKRT